MAEFGLKYYAEMRSKHHNILLRVEIAEADCVPRMREKVKFTNCEAHRQLPEREIPLVY